MTRHLRYIYARGNILVRNFYRCNSNIKLLLFRTYCYNVYCGHLWSRYSQQQFVKLTVAYNNVFRHLFNIKQRCSMSQLYMYNSIDPFIVILRKSIVNFRKRLYNSENSMLQKLLKLSIYNDSCLFKTWSRFIF